MKKSQTKTKSYDEDDDEYLQTLSAMVGPARVKLTCQIITVLGMIPHLSDRAAIKKLIKFLKLARDDDEGPFFACHFVPEAS